MVNRRAFFEIFFYNRENRSREMMEAAESVWRAYMKKYGLGLDAGTDGQPTYDEVREITYLANAAIEAVEKQIAEAEAEEARRKKLQREAWDLGIFAPDTTGVAELEALVMKAMNKQAEEPEEETSEETAEEAAEAAEEAPAEEATAEAAEEPAEEVAEETAEEIPEEIVEEAVKEVPAEVVRPVAKAEVKPQGSERPARRAGAYCDVSLWVEDLIHWCRSKGLQCIQSEDEGDCYLHVYLPHKKEAHLVGKWCFRKDAYGAELAAEMTKLYAYCEGFAACFDRLVQ